jgi:hypothetical protein
LRPSKGWSISLDAEVEIIANDGPSADAIKVADQCPGITGWK